MGQKDISAIKECSSDGFRLILSFSFLMSIPALLARDYIGGLFTDNIEVQGMVATLIIILIVYQFGDGLQFTFANSLRGISCVKPMIYYAFLAYFVINLPLGYILGFHTSLGILGVWIAFPFGLTTAGILYRTKFNKELRRLSRQ